MKKVQPMDVKANGHYSPGVIAGGMLYISGQLPMDPVTGKVVQGGADMQAARSLRNLDKVLIAAGLSRDNVASVHVYISDIADWDVVNAACAEFFGGHKPARVIVPAGKLHHGALVEIEAVAECRGLNID
ncbi:MAG: RidA family protein [Selenomonas sp.]|uniref:RidA family protein n=1 Tax=Selenomonas sp. TaxID=2053611 RepID=UPI0025D472FD|nr:RidA family protein [Selenomonas sp.]MCR5439640.1 RidA family protein [Selenomonas sp.]